MTLKIRHQQLEGGTGLFYTGRKHERAYLSYIKVNDETLDIIEIYVPKKRNGKGIASVLVEKVIAYARLHNFSIIPTCPFVYSYLLMNPQHSSMVAGEPGLAY